MRTATGLSVILLCLTIAPARGDEVDLSRVIVHAGGGGPNLVDFPLAQTQRFCGDEDGCQVVITLKNLAFGKTTTGRLHLDVGTGVWFSSATGGAFFQEADDTPNEALRLDISTDNCVIRDGELASAGDDLAPGFSFGASGANQIDVNCTAVMSD